MLTSTFVNPGTIYDLTLLGVIAIVVFLCAAIPLYFTVLSKIDFSLEKRKKNK